MELETVLLVATLLIGNIKQYRVKRIGEVMEKNLL